MLYLSIRWKSLYEVFVSYLENFINNLPYNSYYLILINPLERKMSI